jgi:exodeoxyribonuclease VII large subunit
MYRQRSRVWDGRSVVAGAMARTALALRAQLALSRADLRAVAERLDALSPMAVLGRGYSIARRLPDRRVISRLAHIREGQNLEVLVTDGAITCLARNKRPKRHGVELDVPKQLSLTDVGGICNPDYDHDGC